MTWSFKLGTIAGTAIRVHVTFVLLLAWIWFAHYQIGGAPAAWEGVLYIVAVFACVVLHEFGHIAAARYYGIRTPDITLLPIGGVAQLERMPDQPRQELVVAIAGPLVNVAIAAVIVLVLGYGIGAEQLMQIEDPRIDFFARLAGVNVFLVLFNLIPAFPMDGGRVLRAVLAMRMPWARATQLAATIGQGFAFVLGFVGLFYNPLLIFIAIFVYLAAAAEAQDAQLKDVAASLLVSDVMITNFVTLDATADINGAVEALLATTQHEFPVVAADGALQGLLTRNDMIRALRAEGPQAPIAAAMRGDVPRIHPRAPLREALTLMQQSRSPAMAVIDGAQRLVGLLTHENLGEMMMIRAARPDGIRFGTLRRRADDAAAR